MTEHEWLACTDPKPMLEFVRGKASDRKLRLFTCACVRRVWAVLPPGLPHEVVRVSEDYADSQAAPRELGRLRKPARHPVLHPSQFVPLSLAPLLDSDFSAHAASETAEGVTRFVGWECRGGRPVEYVVHQEIVQAESKAQADLLRDIFDDPFRPLPPLPAAVHVRNDRTVPRIAQAIYDERQMPEGTLDPARLAVLADALLDAGCDNEALIQHCREPGPHVRGCWAVDLILGRG